MTQGYQRLGVYRFSTCNECGAVVTNEERHTFWHAEQQPPHGGTPIPHMTIGPRCVYCGNIGVARPGDDCGMCAGSKAAQQRRGT